MAKMPKKKDEIFDVNKENEAVFNGVDEENKQKVDFQNEEKTDAKRNIELSDSQATIKAAWIGGIMLLIGGLLTLIGVIYSSNKTSTATIESKKVEQKEKDKSEAKTKKLKSFDEAIASIQQMKDQISAVIAKNQNVTYLKATEDLEKSSKNLIEVYGKLCVEVCETCNPECFFHKAKEEGRLVANYVKPQPPMDQISDETRETLQVSRNKLSDLETDISNLRKKIEVEQ